MRRAVAAAIGIAVAGAIAAVVVLGSSAHARLAGTNGVDAGSFAIVLPSGRTFCEPVFVPSGADRARIVLGSYYRPTPDVTVTLKGPSGAVVATHRTPGGFPQGETTLALGTTTKQPIANASLCFRPDGTKVALGGFHNDARVEFLRPGRESYFALAGTMLHRFGIGKPDWQGPWLGIVAVLLVVAIWALAGWALLRESVES